MHPTFIILGIYTRETTVLSDAIYDTLKVLDIHFTVYNMTSSRMKGAVKMSMKRMIVSIMDSIYTL